MGLVVSPLIALMEDQVAGLRQAGVRAAALHSELAYEERLVLWEQLRRSEIDILLFHLKGSLRLRHWSFLKMLFIAYCHR